ncbi:MAG: RNA polymerase sigma factor [Actinomycetota bacterium]|nr:RNA polymerase sigma factor [Actinomycetota bacterium]
MILPRDPLANCQPLIRRVYAYVAYRIGDGPDAEDVTSETFERAVRYRRTYDRSKGEPAAWLIGIARRVIAARGSEPAEVPTADLPEFAASTAVDDDVVVRLSIRTVVASLEDRDRDLIALAYGADLRAREIGDLLGLETNAVEVALHRARRRLAERLESLDEEEHGRTSSAGL